MQWQTDPVMFLSAFAAVAVYDLLKTALRGLVAWWEESALRRWLFF